MMDYQMESLAESSVLPLFRNIVIKIKVQIPQYGSDSVCITEAELNNFEGEYATWIAAIERTSPFLFQEILRGGKFVIQDSRSKSCRKTWELNSSILELLNEVNGSRSEYTVNLLKVSDKLSNAETSCEQSGPNYVMATPCESSEAFLQEASSQSGFSLPATVTKTVVVNLKTPFRHELGTSTFIIREENELPPDYTWMDAIQKASATLYAKIRQGGNYEIRDVRKRGRIEWWRLDSSVEQFLRNARRGNYTVCALTLVDKVRYMRRVRRRLAQANRTVVSGSLSAGQGNTRREDLFAVPSHSDRSTRADELPSDSEQFNMSPGERHPLIGAFLDNRVQGNVEGENELPLSVPTAGTSRNIIGSLVQARDQEDDNVSLATAFSDLPPPNPGESHPMRDQLVELLLVGWTDKMIRRVGREVGRASLHPKWTSYCLSLPNISHLIHQILRITENRGRRRNR